MSIDSYSDKKWYQLIQSSWTQYFRENVDEYATIIMNDKQNIQPSIIIDKSGIHVRTCQYHNVGQDKFYFFPPHTPSVYILNAVQSYQFTL